MEKNLTKQELRGHRVTAQRRLLLDLIRQAGSHVDANQLYFQAKHQGGRLCEGTVFRTLRLFKELGLVEERYLGEKHRHYELKREGEHYHLICLNCNEVAEFSSLSLQQMREDIKREKGFEVIKVEVNLYGYCKGCRRQQNKKTNSSQNTAL